MHDIPLSNFQKKYLPTNIKIEIENDFCITRDVFITVLEALLKYILYQCRQIPVQIHVLEREVRIWKESINSGEEKCRSCEPVNDQIGNCSDRLFSRQEIRERASQRKREISKQVFERKRKRWLPKVDEVINSYKSTLSILRESVERRDTKTVIFAIGGSPALAKLAFKISLGSLSSVMQQSDGIESSADLESFPDIQKASVIQKIRMSLFRAFANSEELSELVNSYIATSKIWTLIQKEELASESSVTDRVACGLLYPKRDFQLPHRAKVVEITLKKKQTFMCSNIIDMELTPCVDSKFMLCNKYYSNDNTVKRKRSSVSLLDASGKNSSEKYSNTEAKCDDRDLDISILYGNSNGTYYNFSNCCNDHISNKEDSEFLLPLENSILSLVTPSALSNGLVGHHTPYRKISTDSMIETPIVSKTMSASPLKPLTKGISGMNFSDCVSPRTEYLWYLCGSCIPGLKQLYLHKNE